MKRYLIPVFLLLAGSTTMVNALNLMNTGSAVLSGALMGGPQGAFSAGLSSGLSGGSSQAMPDTGMNYPDSGAASGQTAYGPGDFVPMSEFEAAQFRALASPSSPGMQTAVDMATANDFSGPDAITMQTPADISQLQSDPMMSYPTRHGPMTGGPMTGGSSGYAADPYAAAPPQPSPQAPAGSGYGPGGDYSNSSGGMSTEATIGTAVGAPVGTAALLGGGAMAMSSGTRKKSTSGQNQFDSMSLHDPAAAYSADSAFVSEKDTNWGEIFEETDKNGRTRLRIKTASRARQALWTKQEKADYLRRVEINRTELNLRQKSKFGITSLANPNDELAYSASPQSPLFVHGTRYQHPPPRQTPQGRRATFATAPPVRMIHINTVRPSSGLTTPIRRPVPPAAHGSMQPRTMAQRHMVGHR